MQDIENDIARIGKDRGIGRMSRYLRPYLQEALDAVPSAHPLAAQARAVVDAWDGNRYSDAVSSATREAGEVIFGTWLDLMLPAVFGDELGADVGRATPNMLIHVLDDALGGGSGVPPSRDYFNGQDPKAVMSNVFTQALNSLGPNPAAWSNKPRDIVHFRHMLAAVPEFGSMFDSDRDTYAQFVAFTTPIQAGNIFPLGQSGFIQMGPSGTPIISPHCTDLLGLYRAFQYKPMTITHAASHGPSVDASAPGPVIASITPSPAHGTAHIELGLQQDGPVRISIYDIAGRKVSQLLDGRLAAGRHVVVWKPAGAAKPGVYEVRCEFAGRSVTRRLVMTR